MASRMPTVGIVTVSDLKSMAMTRKYAMAGEC